MRVARRQPSPVIEDVANIDLLNRQLLPPPVGEALRTGPSNLDYEAAPTL
jgi:hypothetical protein